MPKVICFLCTGNYYRSRYAEEYFNHLARKTGLTWQADSRALHQQLRAVRNPGPMSIVAVSRLLLKGILPRNAQRSPRSLGQEELSSYDRFIALDVDEHRSYIETHYPQLKDTVEYWDIKDLDKESPSQALSKLDHHIQDLIKKLSTQAE